VGESDWAIYRTIKLGVPGAAMPPHPDLSIEQIWQLVGYIRSMELPEAASSGPGKSSAISVNVPYTELRAVSSPGENWLTYYGDYSGRRHSSLSQINRESIPRLAVRWIHPIESETNMTPMVRDGIMFITLSGGRVLALNAGTGKPIWTRHLTSALTRGVALLDERVLVASSRTSIAALAASSGDTLWETHVIDDASTYLITSAPLALKDLVVTGVATNTKGGRGFVVALDAASGKERWRFEAIPAPGRPHHDTWGGDSWRNGGGPTWLTGTYDPELDLIYWGVGNPKPDYDVSARPGDNLFTNSVVALDATTGELKWYFQFTPADSHDWDGNQVPVLVDRPSATGVAKLLLLANRNGFYYVLDRQTGKYLRSEPFVQQTWTAGIDAQGRPSPAPIVATRKEGDLVFPGTVGGTNWWPPSYDADLNLFFVPALEQGMVYFNSSNSWPVASSRPFYTAIRALDAETGKLKWERRSELRTWRNRSAGVLSTQGGLLFASDMTYLYALDSRNGEVLWTMDTGGDIAGPPMTYQHNGEQFVVVGSGANLLAFTLQASQPERAQTTAATSQSSR
jgi:alcohol dehydrogenase (cytochrome c)